MAEGGELSGVSGRVDVDWPERKPVAWRALAHLDRWIGVSSLLEGRLDAILLYHSVGGVPGSDYDYDLPEAQFREQIRLLSEQFEPVDLGTLIEDCGENGQKSMAVTFDDGFRNVYDVAAPILREFDVPATVFVCPDLLGDADPARIREHHSLGLNAHDVLLTEQQVRDLAADDLFVVGNHTASHARLTDVDDEEVVDQVVGGKRRLEALMGGTVDRFSYPYGAHDSQVADVVADSHEITVTSERGLVGPSADPQRLPRIDACQPLATLRLDVTDLGHHLRKTALRLGVEP